MTKVGRRTADNDSNFPPVRSQRRLHKWTSDKADDLNEAVEDDGANIMNDDNEPLAESLSAISSHLLDKDDEENSSEKDVFLPDKGHGVTSPVDDSDSETEEAASEEYSTKHDLDGEEIDPDDDKVSPKLKSDYSTTPKGLTTWSAVNGASQMPMYTISSVLSFTSDHVTTDRPQTQEMVVIKERVTTTEPTSRLTSKVNLLSPTALPTTKPRRKPYNKNKKVVQPTKFVKPQLEEVTAEVASVDETHVVYKTKVTTEAPEMKSTGVTDFYDRFTTRKPLWPYQMTTRRATTRRPTPFSRVTRPKKPITTSTTTPVPSTTTYLRNPQTSIITPISGLTLSLADLSFMDFLRAQIIPRIGLTLISLMASPLLFSMMSAVGFRRRKRSLSSTVFTASNGRASFESTPVDDSQGFEHFDFSTIQKKLEAAVKQPSRSRITDDEASTSKKSSFDLMTEAFRQVASWWATKSAPVKSGAPYNSKAEDNQARGT